LAAVPGGVDGLLYGRVDLLPTADGGAVVTEVELIEPSLFFGHCPGSAELMAELIGQTAAGGAASRSSRLWGSDSNPSL
jgi:hypothetical protein